MSNQSPLTIVQECKQTYFSKVEALHFATIFRSELENKLGWKDPIITNTYFPEFQKALELEVAGVIKSEALESSFKPFLTRFSDTGKFAGYLFRVVHFREHEVAYFYGQDYVGDELNFYAATSQEKFKEFLSYVKKKHTEHSKKENEGKITVYTLENGHPKVKFVPFKPITEEEMIADPVMIENIKMDLATFFSDDELFDFFDINHRRGAMFDGPPGTGKTTMVRFIATLTKRIPVIQFFASAGCDTSDLIAFFEYVADNSPAVVILEDIDTLFKGDLARSNFLNIIDGLGTDKKMSVFIIATTNHIKEIDEAITNRPSRFDRLYHFPFPSEELRRKYVLKRFSKVKTLVEDSVLVETMVKGTENMSFAHLNEIYTQAVLKAIFRKDRTLLVADVEEAINNVRTEVTKRGGNSFGFQQSLVKLKSSNDRPYYDPSDQD